MKKTVLAITALALIFLLMSPPCSDARGGHWGWWAPWVVVGGAAVLSSYAYPPPYYSYYYYPPYYYAPPPVVVAPPAYAYTAYAVRQAPVQPVLPAAERHFIYPRQGQNEKQQADDRYECHRWAVSQTGFDPTNPGSGGYQMQGANGSDYWRAMGACLDGHGYTVR